MEVPITVRKNNFSFRLNALDVVVAVASRSQCTLHFANGEHYTWAYPLSEFWALVRKAKTHLRAHRSYVVQQGAITACRWLKAQLHNGQAIPLSRAAYYKVKRFLGQ